MILWLNIKFQRQTEIDMENTEDTPVKLTVYTCLPISLQAVTLKKTRDRQKSMTLLRIRADIRVKNVLRNLSNIYTLRKNVV